MSVEQILLSVAVSMFFGLMMTRVLKPLKLPDVTSYLISGALIGALTCQYRGPKVCPKEGIDYFIENTLDLVEFMNGDKATTWGKVRAEMGHPEPFNVKMIQIGNENWGEDFLWNFDTIAKAVKARYPEMDVIGSAGGGVDNDGWRLAMKHYAGRSDFTLDEHYYQPADWFYENASRYDAYDRKGPRIFVGEYASFDRVNGKSRICFDNALGEAALMTGFERNADVVRMAAFAPMFHRDGYRGGFFPSMIHFDGLSAWGRTSYHVQKLFRANLPARTVPCGWNRRADAKIADFFVACGEDGATGELIVKLVNVTCDARRLDVDFGAERPSGRVTRTVLAGARDAENTAAHPAACVPRRDDFAFAGGRTWRTTLPAWSLTILRFPGKK